jgi:DNA mismatch repair protein MutL
MAHPDVVFLLTVDGRETGRWPRVTAAERVADLLDAGRVEDLLPLAGVVPSGTIAGWLARPERGRPNRAGQYLFVNRRPIQSALLRRAVEQGYAQLVPVGQYPVFAVSLEVEPASVDVNVHPRKQEVRFRREGDVFGAVARATRETLLGSPLVRQVLSAAARGTLGAGPPGGVAAIPSQAPQPFALQVRESLPGYQTVTRPRLPSLKPLGQLLATYIVAEGADGLYLVDQHAAHERVVYERLLAARRAGGVPRQLLAVPVTLELTPAQMALLVDQADRLAALGFETEPFGPRTVLVRAIPAPAAGAAPDALVRRAVAAMGDDGDGDDSLQRVTIATACHTAIRAGDRLSPEAIGALLVDLAATEDPYTCFHGRPTVIAVSRDELERWFLRT